MQEHKCEDLKLSHISPLYIT